ncbi:hypothetical protein Drorol1_Dr00026318 [Drosera rotundifolia]
MVWEIRDEMRSSLTRHNLGNLQTKSPNKTNEIRDEKTIRSQKSQSTAPDAKVFRSGLDLNGGENIAAEGKAGVVGGERERRRRGGEYGELVWLPRVERNSGNRVGDVAKCEALISF